MPITPAYLHVVLNHIPLIGMGIGAALLAAAMLRRSDDIRAAALIVIALSGILGWPVAESGEGAEDQIQSVLDSTGHEWFETHEHRAEKALPAVYLTAALAVLALIATKKRPSLAPRLSLLCLVSTLASLSLLGWTAKAGGQIRHSEFRQTASMVKGQ